MSSSPAEIGPGPLPDAAYLATLAGFTGLGPRRLGWLLALHPPAEALEVLRGHRRAATALTESWPQALWETLRSQARACDPTEAHRACVEGRIMVVGRGDAGYPDQLRCDPAPPAVVFMRGEPSLLVARRVGIVGTRNPTRVGLDTAASLGRQLGRVQVAVVSGLAKGIDGAAHRGVLEVGGQPIGVVANGLDRPYPAVHRRLWDEVGEQGLLISEWPPGTAPEAYRFPLRNRLIAALSEVVVVVESRERGGSLSTVREAALRDVQVMAVPGSPMVRASRGTNQLLCDGAAPVTGVDDVVVALGLDTRRCAARAHDPRPRPQGLAADIVEWCRVMPRTLDDVVAEIARRSGGGQAGDRSIGAVAMVLARLERDGWLVESGGWFQVVGAFAGVGLAGDGPSVTATGAVGIDHGDGLAGGPDEVEG